MEQDEFPIRAYGRTELAVCYFPHLNSQAAYRKLQQWINPRCRMYMPVQVRMIVEAIGEP